MLLPLPPQSSKPVPKKSQSSKIVPSHHDPSEKTGENCQTKISPSSLQESPSSLQGALKKRSAFEDLTNVSFEMTHETLYLAVKLVDLYLMKAVCKKDKLQLLGATAFMIAAKFEEHNSPRVDDFVYICDDNYQRYEILSMEINILNVLKCDINIPIAYHFLRRYARCIHTNMKTLTLSRYICEMTLQEYHYVQEKASKLAAASLLLALYMKKLGYWVPFLEHYSGYSISELHPLVRQLNKLLTFSSYDSLKAVYYKYSHPVFFEVAKIPALDMLKLEEILNCDCEAQGLVL
uniref:Cyclin B3 n=1 Tax=Gorilla gorilla gorilla TaxID=9595 RepID=G3RQC9_GORGO